jgi:hypothetical protein
MLIITALKFNPQGSPGFFPGSMIDPDDLSDGEKKCYPIVMVWRESDFPGARNTHQRIKCRHPKYPISIIR